MKYDWFACESFDSSTLRPLENSELDAIRNACDHFVKHFNNGWVEGRRFEFNATPANLEDLDYDFYEFGGNHWRGDHGYGFTCAWGAVLVESFGFEWAVMKNAQSLKDCVLRHRGASHSFFPWQYLWSVVESVGSQTSKAQGAWMRILEEVDSSYIVPVGWYPAIDALDGHATIIPDHVVPELRRLRETTDEFFRQLYFDVYTWNAETDWDAVLRRIRRACGDDVP